MLVTEETRRLRVLGRPQYYAWYVILLLAVVYTVNYMDRMALAVLTPAIKQDLQLSDGQVGLLLGFAFSLFFAICGIPIARRADRGNRRDVIVVALVVWSAMTALSGVAQNFWHLFITRVGVGAGEAGCTPPSQSIICDYIPVRQRAGAFAIHQCGLFAGMTLGMVLAGWLSEFVGWRATFLILGLPGIVLAVVVRTTLREPSRGCLDRVQVDGSELPLRETLRVLWRCRIYRLLVIFCVANGFVQIGLTQWWPSFYTRVHGLGILRAGGLLGLAIGVGSVAGLILGGSLANRLAQRDVRRPLAVSAMTTLLATPVVIGSLLVESSKVSLGLVLLTTLLWTMSAGPVTAALYSVTKPGMRATAGAVATFSIAVVGYSLGPFLVGFLSDILEPSLAADSLRYAMLVPACALPVMAAALRRVADQLPRELTEMGFQPEDVGFQPSEGSGSIDCAKAGIANDVRSV